MITTWTRFYYDPKWFADNHVGSLWIMYIQGYMIWIAVYPFVIKWIFKPRKDQP